MAPALTARATLLGALALILISAAPTDAAACTLGHVQSERLLVGPRPGTFYAVDVLNPDVVRFGGRWLMYFSGNRVHTAAGRWRTGLATARRLGGPYHVRRGWSIPYLNGGTAVWRARLWQVALRSHPRVGVELLSSSDGLRWRRERSVPYRIGPYKLTADHSIQALRDSLRVWATVRFSTVGLASRIAYFDLRHGRWRTPRTVLSFGRFPWTAVDVGAPVVARLPQGLGLFYTGTAAGPPGRSIGLSVHRDGHWIECARPLIPAGSSPWGRGGTNADASVVTRGRRTYVFYGAGPGLGIASDLGGAVGVRVYVR